MGGVDLYLSCFDDVEAAVIVLDDGHHWLLGDEAVAVLVGLDAATGRRRRPASVLIHRAPLRCSTLNQATLKCRLTA